MNPCETCKHAREYDVHLLCEHPQAPQNRFGPIAASLVRADACGGDWWTKR